MTYSSFNHTSFETHMLVYERIKPGSKVLDIGCAGGYFAKELKKKNCKVWGIDNDKEALKIAKKYCVATCLLDLDYPLHPRGVHSATPRVLLPFTQKFDYVLMLDVIEHLRNPESILNIAKKYLAKGGKIIISTPNIAFISIRLALMRGKFEYGNPGIMDRNHLHFYTKSTLTEPIRNCGLKITETDYGSGFSQITLIGKYLDYVPKYWQYQITKLFPELLAYQFILVCSASSTVGGIPSGYPRGVFNAL